MNLSVFNDRKPEIGGVSMFFYNVSSLMIFKYEILYQLTEGKWSLLKTNSDTPHYSPWINSELFLTQGKNNVRTEVDFGCVVPKTNYNLKSILSNIRSHRRIESIGKLCKVFDDINTLIPLLEYGFYEYGYLIDELDTFEEFIDKFNLEGGEGNSLYIFDEDSFLKYKSIEYTEHEMRDDLGMIQNTMRNLEYIQCPF